MWHHNGSALPFHFKFVVCAFKQFKCSIKTVSRSQHPPDHRPSIIFALSNTVTSPRHVRIPSRNLKDRGSEACLRDVLLFDMYITVLLRNSINDHTGLVKCLELCYATDER